MKVIGVATAILVGTAACGTTGAPPAVSTGYRGIDRIEILAKGME